MTSVYILLMITAGAAVAAQVAMNAQLRLVVSSGLWATNISFAVTTATGIAALLLGMAAGRAPVPSAAAMTAAPWWVWLGGFGGFAYVFLALLSAHRLGAALVATAGILGQLFASVLIDHNGWLGMPVHRVTSVRIAGLMLVAAGLALIRWR